MPVMKRNKRFKLKESKELLPNLISNSSFEGKYFKIVQGKSDRPVKFTNQDLRLKAATTYFHLEKARSYFIDHLKSEYVKNLGQIIVRIEHTNKFNELGHFANDNLEPQYNNALTVPAGEGYEPANIKPWENEIWFRPAKKIHLSEIDQKQSALNLKQLLGNFRRGLHMSTLQKFLTEYFILKNYEGVTLGGGVEQFLRTAGASLMLELALSQSGLLESLFTRKWYQLESSLVPEIIYHEFAHIALGDYLELNHSTAVIEGMADFFAGKIANSKELATKVKKYNSFNGKKVKTSTKYRSEFESTEMANTDFLFGLLWQVNEVINSEQLIYQLRTKITTDDKIREGLLKGLFSLAREDDSITHDQVLQLYRLLYERGF